MERSISACGEMTSVVGLYLLPALSCVAMRSTPLLFVIWLATAHGDWRASLQTALTTHLEAGDVAGAAQHYRLAVEGNPELRQHAPVLTNLGLAVQAEGQLEEAVDAFRTVLSLTPDDPNAYFNLARALTDVGDHKEAQESLRACVKLSPTDAEAYYDLGMSLLRQKAPDTVEEALKCVRVSVSLEPTDGKNWVALGDGLAASKRWDESASAYVKATELRPAHAPSWASLGHALEEQGKAGEAEAHWRKAIELGRANGGEEAEWHLSLAATLRRSDRAHEAKASYQAALGVNPKSVEAYLGLGKLLPPPADEASAKSYLQGLRDTYGAALALEPDRAAAYTAIGEGMRMYGLQGGCEEFEGKGAIDMYQQALALVPDNTCALTHVAFGDRVPIDPEVTAELTMMTSSEDAADADDEEDGMSLDPAAPTVDSLCAPVDLARSADSLSRALRLWRRNGLAVFPSLLDEKQTAALLKHVRDAQHGNKTNDFTSVTRDNSHRVHKALPVGEARAALEQIAKRLQPFLESALGTDAPALLESGFMVTAPGASAQNFHRDVPPAVVARSSMTVSIQVSLVDTAATQGCLEVIPGSQTYDPSVSDRTRAETLPKVRVAVPKGTVVVYALHTMHRGSSNTHTDDRPFFFFTLTGDGLAPPGLAYTIEPGDVAQWALAGGKLVPRAGKK